MVKLHKEYECKAHEQIKPEQPCGCEDLICECNAANVPFMRFYFIMSISSIRYPAPPNLSTMNST